MLFTWLAGLSLWSLLFPGLLRDKDADGHPRRFDCDDNNPAVWVRWCPDLDEDGVGDLNPGMLPACAPQEGTAHVWYPTCEL